MRMTFGALVAAGLLLASTGALARPGTVRMPNRYDQVGRPGVSQADTRSTPIQVQRARTQAQPRTTARPNRLMDTRRNRGELWGDSHTARPTGARATTVKVRASSSAHNPMTRRANNVSNCSEFAHCGGSKASTDRTSKARTQSSSRKDAYKAKVWANWSKKFEKWLGPWAERATTAEDFMP